MDVIKPLDLTPLFDRTFRSSENQRTSQGQLPNRLIIILLIDAVML